MAPGPILDLYDPGIGIKSNFAREPGFDSRIGRSLRA
jgi:hypothetical protein